MNIAILTQILLYIRHGNQMDNNVNQANYSISKINEFQTGGMRIQLIKKTLKSKGSKTQEKTSQLTQSPSDSAAGTNTLISLDFAVVIDAPKESLLKYN